MASVHIAALNGWHFSHSYSATDRLITGLSFLVLPLFQIYNHALIEQLINITDAIFLGHVGEIELGASALAGIWYLSIYMLGFGFSLGLQVVIARRNGEQHYSETGKTFFQGLFFLSGLAVLLCLFSKLFSPMILSRLITSAEVYHAVIDYLDGRIWGLLFSFPFLALRSFLVGITRTKALNVAALTAVLVNIPGNWLLIFHWDMGIAGAAVASATTGSLVSNLLGAGQKRQVIPLCNCVVRLGYAIGFPLVILAVIFYRPIIGIYTESTALMQIAHLPFVVMLLNYIFALPGYVYMNSVTGTGATRMTFIFQLITIVAYQIYLWSISSFSTSLSVYWTAEYLYVILLGLLSVIYLKYKHY